VRGLLCTAHAHALGTPAEIETSKAWLRSQGLTGLFNEPLLWERLVPETLHGLEWTLVATVGPIIIGLLLIVWVIWKG
jgi:hypothetical protein